MYELFLIIIFVSCLIIKKLRMAQSVNFLVVTIVYFANEIYSFTGIELNVAFALSMTITGIIMISNVYMDDGDVHEME